MSESEGAAPSSPSSPSTPSTPSTPSSGEHLVAIVFDKPGRATEVLVNLLNLQREGAIRLADAVIITKDDRGRGHVQQTVDTTPAQGAMMGTWVGLLAGLFVGPLAIAGGAAIGALYGKLVDKGLDDGWIKQMSAWLEPGRSGLLLLVTIEDEAQLLTELGRYEGEIVTTDLPEAVRHELEEALHDEHTRAKHE